MSFPPHNLSWNYQSDYMTANANRMLGFIKRHFRESPREVKNTLYDINIRTILEYASEIWELYKQYLNCNIKRTQNICARFFLISLVCVRV